jgi:hypothetical protein
MSINTITIFPLIEDQERKVVVEMNTAAKTPGIAIPGRL